MKKAIALLLIAVLALTCFAACGKKDDPKAAAGPEGVYVIKTMGGEDVAQYLEILEVESAEDFMKVELKADGTLTFSSASEEPTEGTWTQNGDTITLTIDGDSQDATLKDGELTIDFDGEVAVFAKK